RPRSGSAHAGGPGGAGAAAGGGGGHRGRLKPERGGQGTDPGRAGGGGQPAGRGAAGAAGAVDGVPARALGRVRLPEARPGADQGGGGGARGVDPAHCVVIGDMGADVEAALAAGARGVLVPTPVTRAEEVASAPEVAAGLPEAGAL